MGGLVLVVDVVAARGLQTGCTSEGQGPVSTRPRSFRELKQRVDEPRQIERAYRVACHRCEARMSSSAPPVGQRSRSCELSNSRSWTHQGIVMVSAAEYASTKRSLEQGEEVGERWSRLELTPEVSRDGLELVDVRLASNGGGDDPGLDDWQRGGGRHGFGDVLGDGVGEEAASEHAVGGRLAPSFLNAAASPRCLALARRPPPVPGGNGSGWRSARECFKPTCSRCASSL